MSRLLARIAPLGELAERSAEPLPWLPPTLARLAVGLVLFRAGLGSSTASTR